jgi:hypothetical protein
MVSGGNGERKRHGDASTILRLVLTKWLGQEIRALPRRD